MKGSRGFRITVCFLAAAIMALTGAIIRQGRAQTWDVCYEMTNRGIGWTGAGYSGIYGGTHGK